MSPGVSRPNLYGALLAELLRPAEGLLHAVRWALSQGAGGPPELALHVRALSDWRAGNLTRRQAEDAVDNAARCFLHEAAALSERSLSGRPVRAVIVSSSPEVRDALRRRLEGSGAEVGGVGGARLTVRSGVEVVTFDWRRFLQEAPAGVARALRASEDEAAAFCRGVDQTQAFRCNRTAHLRDWGPEPHWVALVELLLTASARVAVLGGGYPYFKVCNTFTQIAASLADASPRWLHAAPPPSRVRLVCASRSFSTDWGSSAWRALGTRRNGSLETVMRCGAHACVPVPLHAELWPDLSGPSCEASEAGARMRDAPVLPEGQGGGGALRLMQQGRKKKKKKRAGTGRRE